jgi:hypothetical protein
MEKNHTRPQKAQLVKWALVVLTLVLAYLYFSKSCSQELERIIRVEEVKVLKSKSVRRLDFQPYFSEKISHVCFQQPYSSGDRIAKVAGVHSVHVSDADDGEFFVWILFVGTSKKPCSIQLSNYSNIRKGSTCKEGPALHIEPNGDSSTSFFL